MADQGQLEQRRRAMVGVARVSHYAGVEHKENMLLGLPEGMCSGGPRRTAATLVLAALLRARRSPKWKPTNHAKGGYLDAPIAGSN